MAFIALIRPVNGLLTALSVYVGALAAGHYQAHFPLVLAAFSAALIASAGYAFNDAIDLAIDRINRPQRPLPGGKISRRTALWISAGGAGLGLLLGLYIGVATGAMALGVILALTLYSLALKQRPFWGNLLVSLVAAAAFLYGALAVGAWGRSWIPAAFAGLYHLGREIVKDLEDIEGDRALGARTLPLYWSPAAAACCVAAIFAGLIALTLLPWAQDIYGPAYLMPVLAVDILLLYVLVELGRHRAVLPTPRLSKLLTGGMLLGLLAIVIGELGR
ncbi:MAG: hypothetical protein GKR89_15955 [Candidatus Latescibacteria bacterium]|nr:hypothetical protein [Candidatus Latescibacterota bacterium]